MIHHQKAFSCMGSFCGAAVGTRRVERCLMLRQNTALFRFRSSTWLLLPKSKNTEREMKWRSMSMLSRTKILRRRERDQRLAPLHHVSLVTLRFLQLFPERARLFRSHVSKDIIQQNFRMLLQSWMLIESACERYANWKTIKELYLKSALSRNAASILHRYSQ